MRSFTIASFIFILAFQLNAQNTVSETDILNEFNKGKQLFEAQQYAAAKTNLINYLNIFPYEEGHRIEAEFLNAVASLKLEQKTAEIELSNFINAHPESYYANQALFILANFKYDEKNFRYALKLYKKVKTNQLNTQQIHTYQFKKGYCHFAQNEFKEAEDLFYEAKEGNNLYHEAAIYYYAHIQYEQGNYATALEHFLMLENSPAYIDLIPYYLVQIYHANKEYERVIKYGSNLLSGNVNERTSEIARIVGDAYYAQQSYAKSIAFLERYLEETPNISRPDIYHLGVAYHKTKQYNKAIEVFSQIATIQDNLTQSAYAYLGDCYLKIEDKNNARMAFDAASRMSFDKSLQEEALYNFTKLTYETAFSPFNEIIVAFERFLKEFPTSKYRDEVYDMLSNVFMTTKNYERAFQSIQKIQSRDARVLKAFQRIAFYRAIELFSDNQFKAALPYFNKAIENGRYDKEIHALSFYWRAETHYRLNDYERALSDLNKFIVMPGAYSQSVFDMAHYNMGYAFFKKKNYSASINWFRKFIALSKNKDADILTDANNRIGDCYYLKRDFRDAINYFEDGYKAGGATADYALYKKAFSRGLQKEYSKKVADLKSLIAEFPDSRFIDDAWFEMGKTWIMLNSPQNAIGSYNALIEKYPKSAYASKAMLNMALVYYNIQNSDMASDIYKDVVSQYPGTEEARTALLGLKNISVDRNNVDEYIDYTKQVGGFATLKNNEEDSLTFTAAEKLYMAGNINDSKRYFSNYIEKYPQGLYLNTAHFYKADCHLQLKEKALAINDLKFVASQPMNSFSEQALSVLAALLYDEKNYPEALAYYESLKELASLNENIKAAKVGIMRCQYQLHNAGANILAADVVLEEAMLEPALQREANYQKAKSYLVLENTNAALEAFEKLAVETRSKEGAEAKYEIARIKDEMGQKAEAEATIFEFIGMSTPHQFWLAKAFILLSDIYIEKDDIFQAKQYLLSVKENYQDNEDGIKTLVNEKLLSIEAVEKRKEMEKRDTLKTYFIKADSIQKAQTDSVN